MTTLAITALQPGHYGVQIEEGGLTTSHVVVLDPNLMDDMGLTDIDGALIAESAVGFLLDREPATALPNTISLRDVDRVNPDFRDELTSRLSG